MSGSMPARETAADALALLEAGNARFVAGTARSGRTTPRELVLEEGQRPFAVVLGCSDSRVPVELIFDQEPGKLFVVRIAGNFLNDDILGSIEFGVANLGARLVVVLGHTKCGAATAAVALLETGTHQPGHIANLVTAVAPAARAARALPGDWLANTIGENVRRNVAAIALRSPIVAQAVADQGARVIGGLYDLETGAVVFS